MCARRTRGDYVFGLTCVNDVTARELQKKDIQFTRAKGFDTFAPIGPCIATGLDTRAGRPGRRRAGSTVSAGRRRRPRELIFPIDQLVAFVSAVMTLLPGRRDLDGNAGRRRPAAAPAMSVTIKVAGVGELDEPGQARAGYKERSL